MVQIENVGRDVGQVAPAVVEAAPFALGHAVLAVAAVGRQGVRRAAQGRHQAGGVDVGAATHLRQHPCHFFTHVDAGQEETAAQVAHVAGEVGRGRLRLAQPAAQPAQGELVVQPVDGAGAAGVGHQQVGDDLQIGEHVLQNGRLEGGVLDVGPPVGVQPVGRLRRVEEVGLSGS